MPLRRYIALAVAAVLLGSGLVVWRASTAGNTTGARRITHPATARTPRYGDGTRSSDQRLQPTRPGARRHDLGARRHVLDGMQRLRHGRRRAAAPRHASTASGWMRRRSPMRSSRSSCAPPATCTIAERPLDPKQFPGVPASKLVPGSAVFVAPGRVASLDNPMQWWQYVNGASWRRPEGRGSTIDGPRRSSGRPRRLGRRGGVPRSGPARTLPTEAQFEFAARGGLDRKRFAWGNELHPHGRAPANIWQGRFPVSNTSDRRLSRHLAGDRVPAPTDSVSTTWAGTSGNGAPTGIGPTTTRTAPPVARNPTGPADSFDPAEPGVPKRVQRGGSFLCSEEYCTRYLVGSRGKGATDSGGSNVSFRGVRRAN